MDAKRYGVGFAAIFYLFNKKRWRAYAGAEYFREDANIDFFDSKVSSVNFGVIWRYRRK